MPVNYDGIGAVPLPRLADRTQRFAVTGKASDSSHRVGCLRRLVGLRFAAGVEFIFRSQHSRMEFGVFGEPTAICLQFATCVTITAVASESKVGLWVPQPFSVWSAESLKRLARRQD